MHVDGQNMAAGIPQIGNKPKIKIIQTEDKEKFEKTFNEMIRSGWTPSPIGHQMFYDESQKKIITCFLCIFSSTL